MISIVFGTYNRLFKLKQAMNSIFVASKYLSEAPEIIVLDGGSNDGTLEYLSSQPGTKVICEGGLHGVTRAYNRGFRLASKDYITWFSDDFVFDEMALKVLMDRFVTTNNNTLLSLSIDVGDGKGFVNYAPNTPVGAGHKKLFQKVDYWSEDFITYASDNDFSQKILMSGGAVVAEPAAKITHNINMNDDLHRENLANNPCSTRYKNLYSSGISGFVNTYVNVWIDAANSDELFNKIHRARETIGWCNFFTESLFAYENLFSSMNVSVGDKNAHYARKL